MLYVKRHEGLQYSPYIEYTCQVLEEASEQVSDLVLVSLVRMQCIVDSTYKSLPIKFTAEDIKAPAWMHGKAARCQLEKYWASLRTDIQQNGMSQFLTTHSTNSLKRNSTRTDEFSRLKRVYIWAQLSQIPLSIRDWVISFA
jgi:hypothetical protein